MANLSPSVSSKCKIVTPSTRGFDGIDKTLHGVEVGFPLELAFDTEDLRDMCEHEATAIARLGIFAAEELKNRLSDIRVADLIGDVLAGRPRTNVLLSVECFQFDLADHYVLTVTANHAPPRLDEHGRTNWSRVRRVKVMSVER